MPQKNRQLIKTGYVSNNRDDSSNYPIAEATYNGKATDYTRLSPYGLCSNPPKESLIVLFNADGNESTKFGIADDMINRFNNLEEGEVCLFNYSSGSYIHLKENGDIEIVSQNNRTVIISGNDDITISGDCDIAVGGNLTAVVTGNANVTATTITLNATNIVLNGNTQIAGTLTQTGGGATTMSGDISTTGEITTKGIDLSIHTHSQGSDSNGDAEVDTGGPQ